MKKQDITHMFLPPSGCFYRAMVYFDESDLL